MGVARPPPSSRVLIAAVAAATMVAGLATFVWLAWTDREATLAEVAKSQAEIARLMEEHTLAVLHINAIQLQRVEDLIAGRPLAALKGSVADWRALGGILAESPMGHSLWIFDAHADLVLSSVRPDGMVLNVADREYFRDLATGGGRFVVSPLITGRLTGGLLFPVARRLEAPDGTFLGVAALSIRADYFLDFYRTLRPEASSVFNLIRTDGTVMLRSPLPDDPVRRETVLGASLFTTHLKAAPIGVYRSHSVVDGIDRVVAYRQMVNYPLVVAAGISAEAVLADWRLRTLRNAFFTLAGLAIILALAAMAHRTARAEARALARYEGEAKALAAALADKDVLFQEIHHRVKNNLQIVSSMLMMQSLQVGDERTREALQQSLDRIQSMGLVHQTLYNSNQAARVEIAAYLGSLVASLAASYGAAERGIAIAVEVDEGGIDLDQAVPLGLLANEAVTNALKHGFPPDRDGRVVVSLRRAEGLVRFRVQDDGIGLDEGAVDGVGLTLIRALARQLNGELTVDGANGGTRVAVSFPAR